MEEMIFFPANFMLQTHHHHHHHQDEDNDNDDHHQAHLTNSLAPPNIITPHQVDFHGGGVGSFLGKRSSSNSLSFSASEARIHQEEDESVIINSNVDHHHNLSEEEEEDGEGCELTTGRGEKKRRLNMEQVKTLEKNFELGNKLDPDRKLQLARDLGLQPRQIAIWFQNRRARWKTKQLEKDYDQLKRHFQSLQVENNSLLSKNNKLQAQILAIKNREPTESINLNKETEGSCSENSSDIQPPISDMINSRRTTTTALPPIDCHPNIITSRPLFPVSHSNNIIRPTTLVAQLLLQGGSNSNNNNINNNDNDNTASARPDLQFQKVDHSHQAVKEESLCNMFCGIDDHTAFWPWLEQQQFN